MNTVPASAGLASAGMGEVDTARFTERDVWRWRRHMGRLCHPLAAVELYALEHDGRRPRLSDRNLAVPVCVYVAVDAIDGCLYIGQCHRSVGGVVQRIEGHHAIPPIAAGLWVLPLRADCPPLAVDRLERRMIRAYRPPYNTLLCPPGSSAGELR